MLTVGQLLEWEAISQLDPIGQARDDYRIALLCSVVTNLAGSIHGKKGQFKPVKPEVFMPKWDGGSEGEGDGGKRQTVEEMKAVLQEIAKASKIRNRARERRPLDRPPRSLRGKRQEKKRK